MQQKRPTNTRVITYLIVAAVIFGALLIDSTQLRWVAWALVGTALSFRPRR